MSLLSVLRHNRLPLTIAAALAFSIVPFGFSPATQTGATSSVPRINCEAHSFLCTDVKESEDIFGHYVGHDEPSLMFYSNQPGSGNSQSYRLTLPDEPPTAPNQAGTGGVDNFQLHPAFWFGMALCDPQSDPEYTTTCTPDSDGNIFDNGNSNAPDYIGHHPGAAFLELQFYAPGWSPWPAGSSCDATRWCVAMVIWSLGYDEFTGQINNSACVNSVGVETGNFAFVTKDGKSQAPASPVNSTLATFTPDPAKDLFMSPRDTVTVNLHDSSAGLQVAINDLTSGQSGSMTASIANGFGMVKFDPNATTCTNIPYAYHPMYSTSSEHTRVPWAAHSYNVAFSDEIGHFEYCNAVTGYAGVCTSAGASDPTGVDGDDYFCFGASDSLKLPLTGCTGSDYDFDGVPYQNSWPGTLSNAGADTRFHPQPVLFTSPLFNGSQNYSRVAFETDLPLLESTCDVYAGTGCTNPPQGAAFYPFYTTRMFNNSCTWQLGGTLNPGTKNTFGGTPGAEYGPLLTLAYPDVGNSPLTLHDDFRNILSDNPCPS